MNRWCRKMAMAVTLTAAAAPAFAGWKLVTGGQTAIIDGISVTPRTDWNQASRRLSKYGVIWTQDGFDLDALELVAAVPDGEPIYKPVKGNPLPRFSKAMLLPELADFFERSFRANYRLTDFAIVDVAPATFGGHPGLRVRYRYIRLNDDLTREGEARPGSPRGQDLRRELLRPAPALFR